MLKIKKLLKEKKNPSSAAASGQKKKSSALKRMTEDFSELELPKMVTLNQEDIKANKLLDFRFEIRPSTGYWKGAVYQFRYQVPDDYPYKPPKITCLNKIYHPNIDPKGNVDLNILRRDWKPILDTSDIVHGMIFLFTDPNPNDPLYESAAEVLRRSKDEFSRNVAKAMKGGCVDGVQFDKVVG